MTRPGNDRACTLLILALACCLPGCREGIGSVARPANPQARGASSDPPAFAFTDVTRDAGVDFVHRHGGSGTHYYVETMSGGCAFFDYDGDGWQDIYLVQGAPLPGYQPGSGIDLRDRIFHNNGDGTFSDVTRRAGVDDTRYGLGCCAGDFDNDGDTDLFLTNHEGNILYRNNGDGTFSDVTAASKLGGKSLCTSAAWVDYDCDGWLDLFVCRYMDYDLQTNPRCKDKLHRPSYCTPFVYEQTQSLLYRNNGDGTFSDVTAASNIGASKGRAMGVACADFNDDGRIDLYVTSDLSPNLLWLNNGDGTFREEGATAGVAYGGSGTAMAGMGVDAADYDNDGRIDITVTNFENEPISIYRNEGAEYFRDESLPCGVGSPSLPLLKWGIKFVDLDLDGLADLFVANGHVDDHADEFGKAMGYAQPCRVYRNQGGRTFADVSAAAGAFFTRKQVARGLAMADYDNDGDMDLLIGCNNQPAILLRNDTPRQGNRWIRLTMRGRNCNRDGIGARVRVKAGATVQTRYVQSGTSYLADHDRRQLFGLGTSEQADVEITWPCGAKQSLELKADRSQVVEESGCRLDGVRARLASRGRPS
jgi:hypothetical protein